MLVLGVDPDLLRSIGLFPGQVCDHSFLVSFDQELHSGVKEFYSYDSNIFRVLAVRELQ